MLATGRRENGRRIVERALPIYAVWGRADRVMVARLEGAMAARR